MNIRANEMEVPEINGNYYAERTCFGRSEDLRERESIRERWGFIRGTWKIL